MYEKATTRFLNTIKGSHAPFIVVKALSVDGSVTNIPIVSGSIKIDRLSTDARRTINFTTNEESLIPLHSDDPLNIYGNHVYAYRGVIWNRNNIDPDLWKASVPLSEKFLRPANQAYELVPLGIFRINTVSISEQGDGTVEISVDGSDISSNISKNHWLGTTTVWKVPYIPPVVVTQVSPILLNVQKLIGTTIKQAIKLLIDDRWPPACIVGKPQYDLGGVNDKTLIKPVVLGSQNPTSLSSTNPWTDISGMAAAMGCELLVDSEGKFKLIELKDPNLLQPVWDLLDGEGGLLISADRKVSDAKAVNYVWASGESSLLQLPLRSIAIDQDPSSPTYYKGAFGVSSQMEPGRKSITTQAQADLAAKTYLNWFHGGDETTSVKAVPNPALDVGDVVRIRRQRVGIFDERAAVATLATSIFGAYGQTPRDVIEVEKLNNPIAKGKVLRLVNSFTHQDVVVSENAVKNQTILKIQPVSFTQNFRRYTAILDTSNPYNGSVNYLVDTLTMPLDIDSPMELTCRERRIGTKQDAIKIAEFQLPDPFAVYQ